MFQCRWVVALFCLGLWPGCQNDGSADSAPFQVLSHQVDGNLLRLDVQYGGGCEDHRFQLCWDGVVATSDPPQISIQIFHYNDGDSCEALLSDSIYVDLQRVSDASTEAGASITFQQPRTNGGVDIRYNLDYARSEAPLPIQSEPILTIGDKCGKSLF